MLDTSSSWWSGWDQRFHHFTATVTNDTLFRSAAKLTPEPPFEEHPSKQSVALVTDEGVYWKTLDRSARQLLHWSGLSDSRQGCAAAFQEESLATLPSSGHLHQQQQQQHQQPRPAAQRFSTPVKRSGALRPRFNIYGQRLSAPSTPITPAPPATPEPAEQDKPSASSASSLISSKEWLEKLASKAEMFVGHLQQVERAVSPVPPNHLRISRQPPPSRPSPSPATTTVQRKEIIDISEEDGDDGDGGDEGNAASDGAGAGFPHSGGLLSQLSAGDFDWSPRK